jgi:predicted RNase H-like nuclease
MATTSDSHTRTTAPPPTGASLLAHSSTGTNSRPEPGAKPKPERKSQSKPERGYYLVPQLRRSSVEDIVGSLVGRRYGGMQPANTSRMEMFGKDTPVWPFLTRFGGPADPLAPRSNTSVFETYPVLAMIALDWVLPDSRTTGRLPKYNPGRKKTFSISDWQYVCKRVSAALGERGLADIVRWINEADRNTTPRKADQDCLDACLCLLVALYLVERKDCLMVGDLQTGYIVVPYGDRLHAELDARCERTGRLRSESMRVFKGSPNNASSNLT